MKRQWAQLDRWIAGFTVVELLVVIAIVSILLGMLLPALNRPPRPQGIKCVNNLKNVGLAFRIFASDNEDRFPMQLSLMEAERSSLPGPGEPLRSFLALSNELSTPFVLCCPADKTRKPAASFATVQPGNISYFIGLHATVQRPLWFLAGDRNLTVDGQPLKPGLADLTTNSVVGWTAEMHNHQGNVAMGDGSVQQFDSQKFTAALGRTGMTNRLAVP